MQDGSRNREDMYGNRRRFPTQFQLSAVRPVGALKKHLLSSVWGCLLLHRRLLGRQMADYPTIGDQVV